MDIVADNFKHYGEQMDSEGDNGEEGKWILSADNRKERCVSGFIVIMGRRPCG